MSSTLTPTAVSSPELNYKSMEYLHPNYRFTRVIQQTGGTSVTLQATGTQDAVFQIPAKAFSFAESYITGTFTPTVNAGTTLFHNVTANTPFVNSISLFTQGGANMCNIENLINYQAVMRPPNTPFDKFMTHDRTDQLFPIKTTGAAAADGQRPITPYTVDRPYTEIQTYTTGAVAPAAEPVIPFVFRLGDIAESIFSMKKAFLFPEFIYLRVQMGPIGKFMWDTTSATVPITGAVAPLVGGIISNFYLYLACEQNPLITINLQAQIRAAGVKIAIPYAFVNKNVVATSNSQVVNIMIQPDRGSLIKKIVHAVFDPNEALNVCVDHSNLAGSKIERYYTQLDSVREQENDIDCKTNFDDYSVHRPILQKSCLQTRNMYQFHWFHMQDYSGLNITSKEGLTVPSENLVSGMPVEGGKTWVFSGTATTAAAYNHYTFVICYQYLVIKPTLFGYGLRSNPVRGRSPKHQAEGRSIYLFLFIVMVYMATPQEQYDKM